MFKIKIENFFFLGKDPYSFTRSYSENKFLQGFGSILKDNFIEIKKKNSENVFLFCRNFRGGPRIYMYVQEENPGVIVLRSLVFSKQSLNK